jgi:hypothetical protein
MSLNDDLGLTMIGAALIASKVVDIHEYDRQLLNQIIEARGEPQQLLQVPVMLKLRVLAQAIQTALTAPMDGVASPIGHPVVTGAKCAHPGCQCAVLKTDLNAPFCSDRCRESGSFTELRCDCQHPACR